MSTTVSIQIIYLLGNTSRSVSRYSSKTDLIGAAMNYTCHNKFYNRIRQFISNIFPNLKLRQIIKKIRAKPALISHTYTYLSHVKQKRVQTTGFKYTHITNKTHRIWIRSLSGVYIKNPCLFQEFCETHKCILWERCCNIKINAGNAHS